ncbi:uncharacterized protein LY79DRAFT_581046 [Colletotrichum navitas]|uniref:Uncharacterized protein n=1 Tax=Colletotrichum navitas TaxID=681940 RepID=A0AAD8PVE2_9PEZI|nr:uncharacterized protein LY79DRAFT_581046 [Colletotrichum navitas]KAK1585424.1 hypothetical protein LY79DRAFT_581046 [Colletotrichum navitas]
MRRLTIDKKNAEVDTMSDMNENEDGQANDGKTKMVFNLPCPMAFNVLMGLGLGLGMPAPLRRGRRSFPLAAFSLHHHKSPPRQPGQSNSKLQLRLRQGMHVTASTSYPS